MTPAYERIKRFRWASLQLDSLGQLGSSARIEEALADLPEGLDEVYARSVREVPKRHMDDTTRILQVLLVSNLRVSVNDILEITSIDLEAPIGHSIDHSRRLQDLEPFSSLMSNLIILTKGHSWMDDDYKCLQLAHSSVRDLLLSETPKPSLKVHFAVISCKTTLVQLLLAYLRSILVTSPVELTSSMESCATYASYEWRSQTKVKEVEGATYDDILKFLLFNSSRPFSKFSHRALQLCNGPPLYVACRLGLVSTVERLLVEGFNPNERKKARLVEAETRADSYYKRKPVEFRLEEREPITDHDDSENALHIACKKGHERVVRLLLDYGAEVDARSKDVYASRTPLCYTCDSIGNEAQRVIIARMLIDSGADVKISKGELGTALHGACWHENLDLATLLIENGTDVNAQAGPFGYSLTIACIHGRMDIADTLIKNGADVNAEGGHYHTALQAAAASGSHSVKFMLDNGANVNVQGGVYGTELIAACENKDKKGVKMLLEHGADPNLQGKRSKKKALIGAIGNGYKDKNRFKIVRVLLENGANVDCPDGEFGSALGAAISRPLWDVVQLLVEKGADFNLLWDWQKEKLLEVDGKQFSAFVIERLEGLEISERLKKKVDRARKHRNRMKYEEASWGFRSKEYETKLFTNLENSPFDGFICVTECLQLSQSADEGAVTS